MRPEVDRLRRHFEGAPEPGPEARERIRARLDTEWRAEQTPGRARRSRKSSSRRAWAVGGCVAAVVTAGTGLAAANGAFGSGQAESALAQSAKTHLAQIATTLPPQSPASTTPPTTTADGVTKPGTQQLALSEPGPDGMTIELWTAPEVPAGVCFVLETSNPGVSLDPGVKPAFTPLTRCESDLASLQDQIVGLAGELWLDAAGHRYMLSVGHVQVPGATKLTYKCGHGVEGTVPVGSGWYVLALPGDNLGGACQASAFDANGNKVATGLHA